MVAHVQLPIPPSVNSIWKRRKGGGVYLQPTYRAWRERSIPLLRKLPTVQHYPAAALVTIYGGIGWRKGRDADNVYKALLDAAQEANVIQNDSTDFITTHHLVYRPPPHKKFRACIWLGFETAGRILHREGPAWPAQIIFPLLDNLS